MAFSILCVLFLMCPWLASINLCIYYQIVRINGLFTYIEVTAHTQKQNKNCILHFTVSLGLLSTVSHAHKFVLKFFNKLFRTSCKLHTRSNNIFRLEYLEFVSFWQWILNCGLNVCLDFIDSPHQHICKTV